MTGAERIKALLQNKPVDKIVVSGWLHLSAVDRFLRKHMVQIFSSWKIQPVGQE
ncbi:MAG: hypothetical protein K0R15_946 [Clostridiales bacterium]|nr:hypothetical protein [Clostridiales bacterium]